MMGRMPEKIRIQNLTPAHFRSALELYAEGGWWRCAKNERALCRRTLRQMVRGSFCFVGAFNAGQLIGMGRAISDGVSDAYIQDVIVRKAWRGHGVGQKIMMEIIRRLRRRDVDWIGLIAQPGSETFYRRLKFSPMPGHTPMRLK